MGKKKNSDRPDLIPEKKENRGYKTDKERTNTGFSGKSRYKKTENPEKSVSNNRAEYKTSGNQKKSGTYQCSAVKKCGSCQYLHLSYADQLKKKQKQAEGLLRGAGKVLSVIGMDNPLYYRNKVHAAFDRDRKGNIICGTYQESTHQVVPVDNCLLEDQKSQAIIHTIQDLLKSFKIKTYDEKTGYGLLRHVLIRRGFSSGEIMVILVVASPVFPSKNNFVKALRKEHPEITTILLNINDQHTSMILGEREIPLYGPGFIKDQLCGCTFRISGKSFYQVNPVQTQKLYADAISSAHLTGNELVLDAYCGIGTISLIAASHAGKVIGVELNPDAVRDARINAKENHITNAEFYQADAGAFMVSMAERGVHPDVVFMDPPRTGSTPQFLKSLAKTAPKTIVYISCNPETLARDLKILRGYHYHILRLQPFDMFPFTGHIETVCLLGRRKPDDTIKVSVNMDDYYQIRDAEEAEKSPS